jgi:folate-binding protein YgfZ
MNQPGALCLLEDYGVLRFSGADVVKFLQGQLSNDVTTVGTMTGGGTLTGGGGTLTAGGGTLTAGGGTLTAGTLLRAGLHNPQGRTLALLALAAEEQGDILALLPLELVAAVAAHLRRYLLRAKVSIAEASSELRVLGLPALRAADTLAGRRVGYGVAHDTRALLLQSALDTPRPQATLPREQWRALDIAAGLPQVYSATSAQFVAQMLNLDCINAVSFTKGCYTGQEVIARAHYRGRIKRRMQRFVSAMPLALAPGDSGRLDDGRSFRVVEATSRADGLCEFLAVATANGAPQEADESGQLLASGGIAVSTLPLPYALPE